MNILHLSTAKTWRGGENQLFLLARGLLERGQKTRVVAPRGAPLVERCREAKIDCSEINIRSGFGILGAWKLAGLIRSERPDILHAHDGHAVIPAKMALFFAGSAGRNVKLVAHRRTVFKINGRSKYQGRVDRVIAISKAARDTVTEAGVAADKISVVFSGMDFPEPLTANSDETRAFREKLKIPQGAFVIAHAAALTHEKRQSDMLEALATIHSSEAGHGIPPEERSCLILAGSGELDAELRAEAKELGLEKHAIFAGFMRDLRPLWAVAHAAFFASEAEGLCTALVEAQGAGLPAVVTRAGGMAEVVEEGATGVIVDIGHVKQMSDALGALRHDPARRKRMGLDASKRARHFFSSKAMTDGVLNVYQELQTGVVKR